MIRRDIEEERRAKKCWTDDPRREKARRSLVDDICEQYRERFVSSLKTLRLPSPPGRPSARLPVYHTAPPGAIAMTLKLTFPSACATNF